MVSRKVLGNITLNCEVTSCQSICLMQNAKYPLPSQELIINIYREVKGRKSIISGVPEDTETNRNSDKTCCSVQIH